MAVPLRTRVFWKIVSTLEGPSIFQLPKEQVRAASERRRRLTRLPGASLLAGRTHRGVGIEDRTCTLADGTALPLRLYRPRQVSGLLPAVVNFHGGGFASGDPQQSQWWCSSVAARAEAVVVSVDYRLAPEHVFPVAAEDCYAATAWVAQHAAELGVDPSRLAVMGDSAGGNLAAVVALLARDRSGGASGDGGVAAWVGPPLALQVLIYPVVDLVASFASESENEFAPVLCKADLTGATGLYCLAEQAADPYVSPLRAPSHADLPPALIQTAQHDPLRDQGPAYAAALRAAGVAVRLTNYIDAVHGYISIPGIVPAARQALAETVDMVRETLSTGPSRAASGPAI